MYFLWEKMYQLIKKIDLFVDGWKMHEVQNYHTGKQEVKESPSNNHEILESKQEKYLGQIISTDGTHFKNIIFRAGKGVGISRLIKKVLNHVSGGKFHFETAVIF